MNQLSIWIFMSIVGLYLTYRKFKDQKGGFNPFQKYSEKEKRMFEKSDKLQKS